MNEGGGGSCWLTVKPWHVAARTASTPDSATAHPLASLAGWVFSVLMSSHWLPAFACHAVYQQPCTLHIAVMMKGSIGAQNTGVAESVEREK